MITGLNHSSASVPYETTLVYDQSEPPRHVPIIDTSSDIVPLLPVITSSRELCYSRHSQAYAPSLTTSSDPSTDKTVYPSFSSG